MTTMQPFYLPEMPSPIAYGFLFAFAGTFALLLLSKMEITARRRLFGALVLALLSASGTVHAAPRVPGFIAQLVLNPCSAVERGSWAYYVSLCFLV